jgi:hypothetical protein
VSIPILVRHGATSATVTMASALLVPGVEGHPARVEVRLEREGTRSAYGDLDVAGASGAGRILGRARGVGIWLPNASRVVKVPLDDGAVLPAGPLVATFTSRDTGEVTRAPVGR